MTRSVHPFSLLDSSLLIIITHSISSQPIARASFEISRRIKEGCKKMRNELGLIARFFHPSRRITFSFIPRCGLYHAFLVHARSIYYPASPKRPGTRYNYGVLSTNTSLVTLIVAKKIKRSIEILHEFIVALKML